jgi:cell wall-associated NlpC family hydrolase
MRIPAILVSLCVLAGAAQAAPDDDIARFIADNKLLVRLDQAAHSVRDGAAELVVNAMGFLGVPYRRGGNSADTGFDCSGFVRAMYEQTVGLLLPRRANEQAAATRTIDRQELQPGDLVFFNTMRRAFSHVGIYVGDGKFIHSPKPGAQVRVEDMGGSYWQRRFDGARRVDGAPVRMQPTAAPAAAAIDAWRLQAPQ